MTPQQQAEEGVFVDDFVSKLLTNDTVLCVPSYEVAVEGNYKLLELVPCKQPHDIIPSCSFLAASVLGIDPSKVIQNESGN